MPRQTDIVAALCPGSHVLIVRLRSLGDCVLSTPAIHLLKVHRPDLQLGVCVEDRFAGIYEGNPDVAAILPARTSAVRSFRAKVCLNLHGGSRSARLTLLSRAPLRAGFDIFRPGWIYNHPIPTAQETLGITRRVHTAEHMASAMFYLGVPLAEVPRARLFPKPGRSPFAPASGEYAVIHPFAAMREKTWPSANFRVIASCLRDQHHMEPMFICGPGDAAEEFADWRTVERASLPEISQLLRDASLFVGNDSGPAHMAGAFGIRQLILFGPSDSEVWAPWQTPHRVLKSEPIEDIPVDAAKAALWELMAPSASRQQVIA